MIDAVGRYVDWLTAGLFQGLVLPVVYRLGLMLYVESAFAATLGMVLGLLQVLVAFVALRPLERALPAERWSDRRAVRPDVVYTLLDRLGVTALLFFVTLRPLADLLEALARRAGYIPPQLENLVPGIAGRPLLALGVYLVVLDLADYLFHRLQHRFQWWWALHATHHSQRQLSLWSDDRKHLLDSVLYQAWRASVALVIGVPGAQFVAVTLVTRMLEQLAHANVRLSFGRLGDRLLVSPRYHRAHHAMIGLVGRARGCNFASVFPLWDMVFGTAVFPRGFLATGIPDQLEGVDYGRGVLSQQVDGLRRLWRALRPAAEAASALAPVGPGRPSSRRSS